MWTATANSWLENFYFVLESNMFFEKIIFDNLGVFFLLLFQLMGRSCLLQFLFLPMLVSMEIKDVVYFERLLHRKIALVLTYAYSTMGKLEKGVRSVQS